MIALWRDIRRYRFALHNLLLKDFRVRYRNMSLGLMWSVLNPLIMLGVLVFIFRYVHPQPEIHHYPAHVLIGLITYNAFTLCLVAATGSIVDNASLVKKTTFPRILLPLSVTMSQLIQVGIQCVLFILTIILLRVPPTLAWLWVPVIAAVHLCFLLGVALISSALNVFFRDVQYLMQSMTTILFWFTPVFYSVTTLRDRLPPPAYGAYLLNPMAGVIDALRRTLLEGRAPDSVSLGFSCVISVGVLLLGLSYFVRKQSYFADRL